MSNVKTYNPKEVTIAWGNHIVTGYADDSFVTIDPGGDGITKKVGCDGEIARSITPDDTVIVKISLLQTSDSNKYFQERHNYDRKTGDGLAPLLIKDLRGGTIISSDTAWVTKPSSRAFGKETNNREWEIHTGSADISE